MKLDSDAFRSAPTRLLEMARRIDDNALPMRTGENPARLPSWASFFGSSGSLTVFVHVDAPLSEAQSALVFALHHAGPRAVHVVLPATSGFDGIRRATAMRVSYLENADVWCHASGVVEPDPLLSDAEVLEGLKSGSTRHRVTTVGDGVVWIDALRAWAELAGLHADRGRGKWYLRGGLMMQLAPTADGWRLQVGAKQAASEPDRFAFSSDEGPTAKDWERIARRIIADSRSAWFATRPLTYAEHDLQTSIGRGLVDLGWTAQSPMLREYPLSRPGGGAGYVDFLGVDLAGILHIVETKLGTDDRMLVLQGLDYWLWVRANSDLVAADVGYAFDVMTIDFVISSRLGNSATAVLNQYQPAVLRRLASNVPWEVHVLPVAAESRGSVHSCGPRQVPQQAGP